MRESLTTYAMNEKALADQLELLTKAVEQYRNLRETLGTDHGYTMGHYRDMLQCNDATKMLLRSIRSGAHATRD